MRTMLSLLTTKEAWADCRGSGQPLAAAIKGLGT
jgi:hypothetical protein